MTARSRVARPARVLHLAAAIALAIGLLGHGASQAGADPGAASARIASVGPIGMTVGDLDRSIDFYSSVLGFEKLSEVEGAGEDLESLRGVFGLRIRVARLRLGDESIELTEYLAPRGRPFPLDTRANDHWFQHVAIIVSDMDRAYARLREHDVEHASTGPQRLPDWNPNAAGIRAFYFRDPDGHFLEILEFPEDKGAARWHERTDSLFLGIDHTAIVVHDTDASLALYRDTLGMRVVGESDNHGTEQAHLNNVEGARLRITTLRAAAGPGIELLEYLAPTGGRPAPADLGANDLAHWQTRLAAVDLDAAESALRAAGVRFVSPGTVHLRSPDLGFREGLLLRDPDGHALELVSERIETSAAGDSASGHGSAPPESGAPEIQP